MLAQLIANACAAYRQCLRSLLPMLAHLIANACAPYRQCLRTLLPMLAHLIANACAGINFVISLGASLFFS